MKEFLQAFLSILILFSSITASADSMFNRKIKTGKNLFQALLEQGVPNEPLDLTFQMFDYNEGRIPNTTYAVIIDYTLPSTTKRFYLLNFNLGTVEKFYVAHGINSGIIQTRNFSNILDSWKSSIGFYFAKGTYISNKNGLSLYLDGIDNSNSNARLRNIVLHGAKYVSDDFILQNKRLGWSEGCPAVSTEALPYLANLLQDGSIIFSYQKDLLAAARQNPNEQNLLGSEILPVGVNTNRTPGEGGGPPVLPEPLPTPSPSPGPPAVITP